MPFTCKLNFYKDEESEYSDVVRSDVSLITETIQRSWPNDRFPGDLRLALISNAAGDHLVLKQIKNGVFEVFYLPVNKRFHFHKKSRKELVIQTLALFLDSKLNELQEALNKTTDDRKYVRKDLFQSHDYNIAERHLRQLDWLFTVSPVSLVFIFIGISGMRNEIAFAPDTLLQPVFMLFLGLLLPIPGLLLHWQYYRDNRNLTVSITRGRDDIKVAIGGKEKHYKKSDILKVVKVSQMAHLNVNFGRLPWFEYGYTEIEFCSGEIINLTNLLVDQLFILNKFQYDNVEKRNVQKGLPFLRKRTDIRIDDQ